MSTLTIGQVAERTGFSTSSLRCYEDRGLVSPATRTDAGYRLYGDDALTRLAFIARAKQLGCSLEEIKDLLAFWSGEHCGPVQRRFHDLITAKLEATQRQIAEQIAFASQLQDAAARLDTPAIDGPCDDNCACISNDDSPMSAPVPLSLGSSDPPIACTLGPEAMPERIEAWQSLLAHVRSRATAPDGGLRVEFEPGVDLGELTRLVAAEQRCCSFFAFTVTIDPRGIALEINVPEDAAGVVNAVFGTAS